MLKVAFYGVGAIAGMVIKHLLKRGRLRIVAAVDRDPNKIGRDLGVIVGVRKTLGVPVSGDGEALIKAKPEVTVHAATSRLEEAYTHIMECVEAGSHVVSTCEELYYPELKSRRSALDLDQAAKKRGVSILATGINPGFMMDTLPILLTAPCVSVECIRVERVIDAARRRPSFQSKIGMGLTMEEFHAKVKKGELTGHIGLEASLAAISHVLELRLSQVYAPPPEPVIVERELKLCDLTLRAGMVSGLRQRAVGIHDGVEVLSLELWAYAKPPEEYDSVKIKGEPSLNLKIIGGVHGDLGTVGMIVNSIPYIMKAPPGLHSMFEAVPVHALKSGFNRNLTRKHMRFNPQP